MNEPRLKVYYVLVNMDQTTRLTVTELEMEKLLGQHIENLFSSFTNGPRPAAEVFDGNLFSQIVGDHCHCCGEQLQAQEFVFCVPCRTTFFNR